VGAHSALHAALVDPARPFRPAGLGCRRLLNAIENHSISSHQGAIRITPGLFSFMKNKRMPPDQTVIHNTKKI
jgi:hypothetical protein